MAKVFEEPVGSKALLEMIEKKRMVDIMYGRNKLDERLNPSTSNFSPQESTRSRVSVKYDYKEDPQIIIERPFKTKW